MDFLYRWRRPLIAVLAMMVLATLLSYTSRVRRSVTTLQGVVMTVTTPVAGVLSGVGATVSGMTDNITQLFRLEQENAKLKRELELLHSMRLELEEMEGNNAELRGLLYLKQSLGRWRVVAATVVGRNPDTWFATVTVDEGSLAGIRDGMPVLVAEGVVGRIVAVTPNSSQVMLLTDPASGVGAMDVRSEAAGVLLGRTTSGGTLQFQLFSHRHDVETGDAVVTSGYSQYYPKGLLLGQVVHVASAQFGLTEVATVEPSVDFNQLDTVLVLVSHPTGAAVPPVTLGQP